MGACGHQSGITTTPHQGSARQLGGNQQTLLTRFLMEANFKFVQCGGCVVDGLITLGRVMMHGGMVKPNNQHTKPMWQKCDKMCGYEVPNKPRQQLQSCWFSTKCR